MLEPKVMPSCVLGLLFAGKNPSACLLRDGRIVAFVEEERFTRVKHAENSFPLNSTKYCLDSSGIRLSDVEVVSVGWDAAKYDSGFMEDFFRDTISRFHVRSKETLDWQKEKTRTYNSENLLQILRSNLGANLPPVEFLPHHLCHAASTFFLSGFEQSNVLTCDGHGEEDCTVLWYADHGEIEKLEQINIPHSLGWFYTLFTKFLGFKPHDGEGKTMGLAAYGNYDSAIASRLSRLVFFHEDRIEVNADLFYGPRDDKYKGFPKLLIQEFGTPRSESNAEISQYYKDLAFVVQQTLEKAVLFYSRRLYSKTGCKYFCLAGGTFMNCKANGVLARADHVDGIFVIPTSSDNGISIGAAMLSANKMGIHVADKLNHMYFGPEFGNNEIEDELRKYSNELSFEKQTDISLPVAQLLGQNMIVAWFQGRMEGGARALGNRSILANPLDPKAKDVVNARVKFREMWRPFCPSVIEEESKAYFDIVFPSHFMIIAAEAKVGIKDLLPSVVHYDNTVRPQEVSAVVNPRYWRVINEFGRITGHPVVLNTSFNVKGEPIICTPTEAIRCFLRTDLDYLAIGDYLVWKKRTAYEP
jgi:carbamoyltransferase